MKPSQWTLRWVTLCGCGMLAASAAAVELPGTVQPSQLDERFKPRSEPQAKPEAPLVVPKQVAPQGSEQIRFELREIRIEGNTRYDKAVLESYYQHMLGKQVSLAELVDLANRLTAKYRQDGYLLTQVVVPEQSIEGGKVRLQVIEGYLEHVQIKGTVDGPRVRVEELLAPLTEKRPLDANTLERGLLLVGDLPGVNVQSVLSPGQALGSSNLDVALQQQRYEGFVSLDNRGSHYTDPTTLAFGATEFSRLGFYEQIDVLGAISPFSDATRYIQLRGTLPLGGMFAGDTLQIMGSYSKVNPDIPDSVFPFDSVSKSTEGSISYNHPFIRSRSQNLSGGLALQWKDTETRLRDFASDASNPGRDHVRVFQQRLTYDWVDRWMGINLAEVRNNIGLDMWGATKKDDERRSREVADGRFVYLNGNIGRLQGLGGPWSVYGELQWQYSFDPLLPSERFGVGGSGIGRGFAPGNITGDRGFALKLEPRYGQAVGYSWLRSYQAYAFYDWGKTYNLDVDDDEQQKLGSIGAGVRFNLTDQLSFNPEIARQVIGEPADQRDGKRETRVLFNVVARF
ncbi:TPA: two-partner secretion system transporter CdrB [Pseudomonas aeruginosa]|nr:two-partner secretion system transporter CdrB [Pseudomonas aeruginosa]